MRIALILVIVSVWTAFTGYSIWLFTTHEPFQPTMKYTEDRRKRNASQPTHSFARFELQGGPEWNNSTLNDYHLYSFKSCLNDSLPEEFLENVDHKDDSTCTTTINNKIMARVRWRGGTRPPRKVTFKLKLVYCKCDNLQSNSSCEWKKKKIGADETCIGYTGEDTDEWTLRSDRWDTITMRDWFSWQFFKYMGGRDDMWGTLSTLTVNSQQMGLYLFVTSPEKELIEDSVGFDDDDNYFWEYTGEKDKYFATGQRLELKEPDPEDWCNVQNTSSCDDESRRVTEFRNLVRTFANGTAQIDNQTMAARFWMQAMSRDLDAMRSTYFYSVDSVVFAGPAWDHGWALLTRRARASPSCAAQPRRVAAGSRFSPLAGCSLSCLGTT